MTEFVDPHIFWPAVVNMFAFTFLLIGMATCFSATDRYGWRTIGYVVAIIVVQRIVEIVGMSVEGFQWLKFASFFSAYEPVGIVAQTVADQQSAWSWTITRESSTDWILGPLAYDVILVGMGVLFLIAAAVIFTRRDLPAPL